MESVREKAIRAKKASIIISNAKTIDKNNSLLNMANALDKERTGIIDANKKDLEDAKKLMENGELSYSIVKRLEVTDSKINEMINGIKDVAKLADPLGNTLTALELDTGLELYQVVTPIGVIGMVFESRPAEIASC